VKTEPPGGRQQRPSGGERWIAISLAVWRGLANLRLAALAYHGNGVAMGSYAGHLVADLMAGAPGAQEQVPEVMRRPLKRFPLPGLRAPYLKAAYALYGYRDGRG